MARRNITDPVERLIAETLKSIGVRFVHESENKELTKGLDFYVPGWKTFIEVKRLHSDRISDQMARVDNVIAIQGMTAARMFAAMISGVPA